MFYGKDSIENSAAPLLKKLEELDVFFFEPMPSHKEEKEGSRWTDELRIRDGHTKLADGSWVTVHKASTYLQHFVKNTVQLYDDYQKYIEENSLIKRQKREMEYGLRVAEKALKTSLALTKEMINE